MINCKWLPEIIKCDDYDYTHWNEYLDKIYKIFQQDFIFSKIIFENKIVNFRKAPKDGKYEHTFIHLTHADVFHKSEDPNDRVPDTKRAERIGWNKPIIENYKCKENCINCEKILYFEKYYKKNVRAYFLFKNVRFLVILEKRKNYNLFITGYYVEYDNAMNKYLKNYKAYTLQKTPLA